jgi:divalent metal cation (Fe/Co/Zn/Cd) transporter
VIWASAAFAGYESARKLADHGHTAHVGVGIAAAVVGILGNQAVARYKLVIGRRIGSATLLADARHSWLDALSSAGALAGLVAVAAGWRWGDPDLTARAADELGRQAASAVVPADLPVRRGVRARPRPAGR